MLAALRAAYMSLGLDPAHAAREPLDQFAAWFAEAQSAGLYATRAMTLATVNPAGQPSARMILLAGFDARGFAFCTDDRSPKARDLARQPHAALVFHWAELERQVRAEGRVEPVPDDEADLYFAHRAWAAQVAAWAGEQSAVIPTRAGLEQALLDHMTRHAHGPVPRPPHYLGFRLRPSVVEFWQGRTDRLHDRVRYTQQHGAGWLIERLAP
jgi:pyridoxamine 5'-phosphate oxidase